MKSNIYVHRKNKIRSALFYTRHPHEMKTVFKNPQEMAKIKKWILAEENHKDVNCLVTTLLCHGDEKGHLSAAGGGRGWFVEDFVQDLSLVDNLLGKPKILVLQSCRGGALNLRHLLKIK